VTLRLVGVLALVSVRLVAPASAQAPPGAAPDTAAAIGLKALVVTADRTPTPLGSAIAAVSRIDGARLRGLPRAGFADALRLVPGFALIDFDGLGHDPQPMVRGFYGGGEAEYVLVMVDGRPLNDLQSGLVAWELVPPLAVERIEVVRGSASALYGDAAIGGVVNVVTDPHATGLRWDGSLAAHDSYRAAVRANGREGDMRWTAFGGALGTGGFRDHAARTAFEAGASLDLAAASGRSLSLGMRSLRRELELPGPLPAGALAGERARSEPFYRFDGSEEWVHRATLAGEASPRPDRAVSAALAGELRRVEAVRTLPLTPDFADTKERRLDTERLSASLLLREDGTGLLPVDDRLLLGVDAAVGRLDSGYRALLSGPPAAYESSAERPEGELDARGDGARRSAAAFAQYEAWPWRALRLSVGARMDWLRDTFEARAPSEGGSLSAGHTAFSPRAGLNLGWIESARQRGHLYVAWGRSFKAPTPDQLFDQRSIPLPFPPFTATTSNPLLDPQRGESWEAGAYHDAALVPGRLTARASVAVYRMALEDELDFDLQTLRYVNLGRSLHHGVEAGLSLEGPRATALFVNHTLQSARSRTGDHAGRQLKAIPRHFVSAGLSGDVAPALGVGVWVTRAGRAWLDDANALALPGWTRVDGRLSLRFAGLEPYVEVRNVLDRAYSTTGFPDPSGSDLVYYRPAAGRTLRVGVSARE
jgi:outer membrane receptor protein involved in Fe transport